MTGNAKEMLAKLREKAAPLAATSLEKAKSGVGSVRRKACSMVGRLTVKERLLVLFAIGVVLGFGVKTTAGGYVTIGYQDYSLKGKRQAYDLNEVQRRVAEKNAQQASGAVESGAANNEGGSCQ